jgi:aryl-alcohol dehydrogenase-like predicted oxidoreductase
LDQVAAQYNSTPAQIALAWLMARPGMTAPIASATSVEQLNDLIEATKLELDQSAIDLLDQASAEQSDKGKSYARTQSS